MEALLKLLRGSEHSGQASEFIKEQFWWVYMVAYKKQFWSANPS
jgi:hypothetical protein